MNSKLILIYLNERRNIKTFKYKSNWNLKSVQNNHMVYSYESQIRIIYLTGLH